MDESPQSKHCSRTETPIDERQLRAIIQATAFEQDTVFGTHSFHPPDVSLGISLGISKPFARFSNVELGKLERLPPELLGCILVDLDLWSLFKLRQVCVRARQIVSGLREYHTLASYGLECFGTLLRNGIARSLTLFEFDQVICEEACAFCGGFGSHFFFPIVTRCCEACALRAPQTAVRDLASVQKKFGFDKTVRKKFKTWKVHARKKISPFTNTKTTKFRSVVSLQQVAFTSGMSIEDLQQSLPLTGLSRELQRTASCNLPIYSKRHREISHGIQCAGCHVAHIKATPSYWHLRYEESSAPEKYWRRLYLPWNFLNHFERCIHAQHLWMSSKNGEVSAIESYSRELKTSAIYTGFSRAKWIKFPWRELSTDELYEL